MGVWGSVGRKSKLEGGLWEGGRGGAREGLPRTALDCLGRHWQAAETDGNEGNVPRKVGKWWGKLGKAWGSLGGSLGSRRKVGEGSENV